MTRLRIRKIDTQGFNERARRVYDKADIVALEIMLEDMPDTASDGAVADELETYYDDWFGNEEDLMDGDLEDQLDRLLVAGDEEDRRTRYNMADLADLKEPRHAIDDLEKRYVVLTKLRGRYLADVVSDDLDYIMKDAELAYQALDAALHEAKDGGEASITVFDRDEDRDLYHVELIYYPKEVQG